MKVLKFGGTSVGSVNSMLSVKRIVEGIDDKVIVVVSALGITDKLICTSKMAASGDDAYGEGNRKSWTVTLKWCTLWFRQGGEESCFWIW